MSAGRRPGKTLPPWTGLEGLLRLRGRIERWLVETPWVEAAALFGSTERSDRGADDWSDLDVLLVVGDRAAVVADDAWPTEVGEPWISLVHDAPVPGIRVRQVLYAPGHDVDWVPVTWADLAGMSDWAITEIAGHGARVLKDPDGGLATLIEQAERRVPARTLPSSETFHWTVDDLLYQAVWAAKRLRRGDLWRARDDIDHYLKEHLLSMLEWHALATRPGIPTFPEGRLLLAWADPSALAALPATFGAFRADDQGRALLSTIDLFGSLARTVAASQAWTYPEARHATVVAWVTERLLPGGDEVES